MMRPAFPSTRKERAKAYLFAMEEIRGRFEAVDLALASQLHPGLVRELCYLQFRHICELVAIGCLTAQGDFASYRAFREEYNPAIIFRYLEKQVEHFFPQPMTRTKEGRVHQLEANSKPNAITRSGMEALWSKSGNYLHRLSTAKFFKPQPAPNNVHKQMLAVLNKIRDLLDNHCITIPSANCLMVVTLSQPDCRVLAQFMNCRDNSGNVEVEEFRLK